MKKELEIYKRLHGHICQHPNCQTAVLGEYCLEHIEQAIAQQWEEIETADKPRPTGEQSCFKTK
jgi:hypothetical protein